MPGTIQVCRFPTDLPSNKQNSLPHLPLGHICVLFVEGLEMVCICRASQASGVFSTMFLVSRLRSWSQDVILVSSQDHNRGHGHCLGLKTVVLVSRPWSCLKIMILVSRSWSWSKDHEMVSWPWSWSQDHDLGLKTTILVSRPRSWSQDHDLGLKVSRPWSWSQDHDLGLKAMILS